MVLSDARESGRPREDLSALAKQFRAAWREVMGGDDRCRRSPRKRPIWESVHIHVWTDRRVQRMHYRRDAQKLAIARGLHPRSVEFEAFVHLEMETHDSILRLQDDMSAEIIRGLSGPKVPYIDAGLALIAANIRATIEAQGWMNVAVQADLPTGIHVEATLPGTIDKVVIQAKVDF